MSNEQELPDDLKNVLSELSSELGTKRYQKHLDSLKDSVQSAQQLTRTLQNHFQNMALQSIDQASRIAARKALVSTLQNHTLTLNSLAGMFSNISTKAKGLVQRVLDWIMQNIVQVLSSFSAQLDLKDWSVQVTGGLPLGLTFSVTVTFR